MTDNPSRRRFLASTSTLAGSLWFSAQLPAIARAAVAAAADPDAKFEALSPQEAVEVEAIAATIIPSDGTPGAREAGVIWFIDRALASRMAPMLGGIRKGLGELQAETEMRYGKGRRFSGLADAQQVATLEANQRTPLFGMLRMLTVAGMFALPSYGGNREHAGWKLIGFDHRHGWSPPFGYYDALDADVDPS